MFRSKGKHTSIDEILGHRSLLEYTDGSFQERTDLPIRILNPGNGISQDAWALLDTGADTCVIPRNISDAVGHDFDGHGVKSEITSGVSGETSTYKHTFILQLYDDSCEDIVWSSGEMLVDCVDTDGLPPLIGVRNFLKDFKVTIDYPKKTITLSWN